jgi:hypothetical protein
LPANHQREVVFMKWTTLNFGKYARLSLPQIILADADCFFWALNKWAFSWVLSMRLANLDVEHIVLKGGVSVNTEANGP